MKFKTGYEDESTEYVFLQTLAMHAMAHDMRYVNGDAWELRAAEEAMKKPGAKPIGGRWVQCSNGDVRQVRFATEYRSVQNDALLMSCVHFCLCYSGRPACNVACFVDTAFAAPTKHVSTATGLRAAVGNPSGRQATVCHT